MEIVAEKIENRINELEGKLLAKLEETKRIKEEFLKDKEELDAAIAKINDNEDQEISKIEKMAKIKSSLQFVGDSIEFNFDELRENAKKASETKIVNEESKFESKYNELISAVELTPLVDNVEEVVADNKEEVAEEKVEEQVNVVEPTVEKEQVNEFNGFDFANLEANLNESVDKVLEQENNVVEKTPEVVEAPVQNNVFENGFTNIPEIDVNEDVQNNEINVETPVEFNGFTEATKEAPAEVVTPVEENVVQEEVAPQVVEFNGFDTVEEQAPVESTPVVEEQVSQEVNPVVEEQITQEVEPVVENNEVVPEVPTQEVVAPVDTVTQEQVSAPVEFNEVANQEFVQGFNAPSVEEQPIQEAIQEVAAQVQEQPVQEVVEQQVEAPIDPFGLNVDNTTGTEIATSDPVQVVNVEPYEANVDAQSIGSPTQYDVEANVEISSANPEIIPQAEVQEIQQEENKTLVKTM